MKLYLAGIYTANFDLRSRLFSRLTDVEKQHRTEVKYLLESYHYINRQSSVDKIRRDNRQVFLDSGAFSSFTKGVEVDMPAYCQYVKDNVDIVMPRGNSTARYCEKHPQDRKSPVKDADGLAEDQ